MFRMVLRFRKMEERQGSFRTDRKRVTGAAARENSHCFLILRAQGRRKQEFEGNKSREKGRKKDKYSFSEEMEQKNKAEKKRAKNP